MLKYAQFLSLLILLVVFSGCQTIRGATTGFGQDVQNISNPDQNGWNSLEKVDAWIQKNMW